MNKQQNEVINCESELSLNNRFWALHEAVWELIGWPKKEIYYESPGMYIPEDIKLDRPFFYIPHSGEIDFKVLGKHFEKVFTDMKKDIEYYYLPARHQVICSGSNYLVSPWSIIVWALKKGVLIRERLLEKLQIRQDFQKTIKSDKVNELTKALCILSQNPNIPIDTLCKQIKGNEDTSSLRKEVNKRFFDIKGEPGRPKDNKKSKRKCKLMALPEVRSVDETGTLRFNFPLLEVVISVIFCEKIKLLGLEPFLKLDVDEFIQLMGEDLVVSLYLNNSNEMVFNFICTIIEERFYLIQCQYDTLSRKRKLIFGA